MQKKVSSYIVFMALLSFAILLGFSSAILPVFSPGAATAPDHITLTWTDSPQTTQTITWRTDRTIMTGQVQYTEAAKNAQFVNKPLTAVAGVKRLSTNLGDVNIHSVTLTGLAPGTRYHYRAGDGSRWSEIRTFATSAVNVTEFKFLVFGDSQSISYNVWRTTLHQAYQAHPDAVFFTNVGDLVEVGQDYAQWNAWFYAARGVIDTIPAMPVTGNHETATPDRWPSLPVLFTALFKLPLNGPAGLKEQVYSWDYGDVHFIVLDSQESEQKQFVPDMLARQRVWLENDLQSTDKKWKIVFIHRPPYSNKAARDNSNIRGTFVPVFDKYHVDIVFTAHDHIYARTYPLHGGVITGRPAEGTVYVATGRSGTKTYRDVAAKVWNEFFHNPLNQPNYIVVEVRENILKVNVFTQSGELIDVWTIAK